MTDNTPTERIRAMLDERGVEYTKRNGMIATSITHITHWCADGVDAEFTEQIGGGTRLSATGLTPEQAIAATLGSGTCELHDCEGSFSAVSKPVWRCDCGAFMTQYTDATTYHKPRYCPNCGKKIEAASA